MIHMHYYNLILIILAVAIGPATGRGSQGYRSGSHEFVQSVLSEGGRVWGQPLVGIVDPILTLNSKAKP